MTNDDAYREKENWGAIIPIFVLVVVFFYFSNAPWRWWLLIPIFILVMSLLEGENEQRRARKKATTIDYWRAPEEGTYTSGQVSDTTYDQTPIYNRRQRSEQSGDCGLLFPIIILGIIYWIFQEEDWSFFLLIPIGILGLLFIISLCNREGRKSRVRREIDRGEPLTVPEIASRSGVHPERVRHEIVRDKKKGTSDVWFDPSTGSMTSGRPPSTPATLQPTHFACPYCGFANKPEDNFCRFCGAEVRR